ncbi:uncharacterized protein RB166_013484 [Leptodactylus fuscus]
MVGCIIRGLSVLLAVTLIISEGQALVPVHISGVLHSAMNLTTSFDPSYMKDISWFAVIHGEEYRIMKVRHGVLDDRLNSNFQPFRNGTILGISNITHGGLYTADVTFLDNRSVKEVFNVTLREEEETDDHPTVRHIRIPIRKLLAVVAVMVVVAVLLWKRWKTLKHLHKRFITEDTSY